MWYSVVTVGVYICLWRAYKEATENRYKCAPVQSSKSPTVCSSAVSPVLTVSAGKGESSVPHSRVYQEWEKHQKVQRTLFSGSHWMLGPCSSLWLADKSTAQASATHTSVAPHTFPRLPVVCQRKTMFSPQSQTACGSMWMILCVRPTLDQEQSLQEKHRKTTKTTSECLHTAPW